MVRKSARIQARESANVDETVQVKSTTAKKPHYGKVNGDLKPQKRKKLQTWNELPDWQRDNRYILGGYRPASGSFIESFWSWTYLHNESVNIYTHLIGAVVFVYLSTRLTTHLLKPYASSSSSDAISIGIFFISAVFCLGCSSFYHTVSNHSVEVNRWGNKLDYLGICILIVGSFIPSVHYGFYCNDTLRNIYWFMIGILGFITAVVAMNDRFRTPRWRKYRAAIFVGLGLSAVFPVVHAMLIYHHTVLQKHMGLYWLLLSGGLYIFGAYLYAIRFPEKKFPGKVDIFGSSHQIFHIFVVAAAIAHLLGLLRAIKYRHGEMYGLCE